MGMDAAGHIRIVYREYVKDIPDEPQFVYADYSLSEIKVRDGDVEGTATMLEWLLKKAGRKYKPSDFRNRGRIFDTHCICSLSTAVLSVSQSTQRR